MSSYKSGASPTAEFSELGESAQENALWEIEQRNKTGRYMAEQHPDNPAYAHEDITKEESVFYMNGVFANTKS
jgi:hypothetical protein